VSPALMAGNSSGAVVVTGASTGIGRATALMLDSRGYRVFAGVRKQADAKSLAAEGSDGLTPVTIDVTKERSIAAAKRKVQRAVGKDGLVGLVNNAGIGRGGPIEYMDVDDLREQLEVNLVGQVAVTQAFLPLLRKGKGTVVFIGSIGGRIASPFMSPYNVSKFGIEALGESLRAEVKPWDIDVVVVEPGSIDTAIWGKAGQTVEQQRAKLTPAERRLYGKQLDRMEEMLRETADRGISPDKVARVVVGAISSAKPKYRYLVGTDAKIAARLRGALPDRTFANLVGRQAKMPTDVPPQ
jgi:NAD(P)-dependent dehydrogenase (short-subunit alcohol dehydrogenase family)